MEKTPIYHTHGGNPCGRVAFYFLEYEGLHPSYVDEIVLPDGTRPEPDTLLLCGNCQEAVNVPCRDGDRCFLLPKKRV